MTAPVSCVVDATAPATRLATLRIALGAFVSLYFAIRLPVFLELADRSADRFEPVGVAILLDRPVGEGIVTVVAAVTIAAAVAVTLGWRHLVTGPVAALGALLLTTYRSSWGQLLHFENLFVLLLMVVAFSPAADAWSLDARRRRRDATAPPSGIGPDPDGSTAYGWPLQLACVVVVTTYLVAGVAKLRYGGVGWTSGDTLANHVASSAARLELFGATPAPFAASALRHGWLLTPAAVATVALELLAPLALFW